MLSVEDPWAQDEVASFEIPVRRDRGNFAFTHPFAYAAEQGSLIPPISSRAA